MEKANFLNILHSESKISETEVLELEATVKKHPYFQAAKALYLKGLKQNNNYKYNKTLKETAAFTCDRSVLFDFITDFHSTKTAQEKEEKTSLIRTEKHETVVEIIKEELEIGKPLDFNQNESHSFGEWLQLSSFKKINRESNIYNSGLASKKLEIIDRFIEKNPSIQPIEKTNTTFKSSTAIPENSGLMTETLAKVYLEQKKYDSAVKAYQILILKYPEKSGFFADQIKKIEHLKNK